MFFQKSQCLIGALSGKMGKKSTSAPSTEKVNTEEKLDKPAQSTVRKEPMGRISMFTVPMKITPTKPPAKEATKRIALTPVLAVRPQAVNPTVAGSPNQTNSSPIQPAPTMTPITSKQATLASVPGQCNVGQITPRRVPLMPAGDNQAHTVPKLAAQVPPRRVTLTPFSKTAPFTGPITNNTETRQGESTSQQPLPSTQGPEHMPTPSLSGSTGSSNKNEASTSAATSSVAAGVKRSARPSRTSSSNTPRRISLTTLSSDVGKRSTNGSAQTRRSPETNSNGSNTSVDNEKVTDGKEVPSGRKGEKQPTPVEASASTVKSSQPRRVTLTSVPVESAKVHSSQSPSSTCLPNKENNAIYQLPNNGQPQPRRVAFTTLGTENTKGDGFLNSSRKSPTQSAPRRPIPLEPSIIVLDD